MSAVVEAPAVTVEVGGTPLPEPARRALVAARVDQVLSAPARVELSFAGPPAALDALAVLEPGAELVLRAGRGPALVEADVTVVEQRYSADGDRQVVARGYDRLDRLRAVQRSVEHTDTDLAGLAGDLAGPAGLDVACDEDTPRLGRVLQCQRSDLDLLRTEAERLGLYLTVRGRTLHLLTLAGDGPPAELALGAELLEVTVESARAAEPVGVRGWDPATAAAVAADAAEPRPPGAPPPAGGVTGRFLAGLALRDEAHALARARAELDRRAAASAVATGHANGSSRLRPGATVRLRGLDGEHADTFVLTSASHRIDATGGWVTAFSTRPPDPRPTSSWDVLTLGEVVEVDDPEGLGRVRVALAAFDDLESGWLAVVSAGAGAGKGMVATPDSGDRVAVLVPRDDPGLGVVLGGLYGTEQPPEAGVVDGRTQRTSVITAGGLRVVLSDDLRTLRLEDPGGSHIELGPEGVELLAAQPLDIAAPGQPVRIRGARIDFERA